MLKIVSLIKEIGKANADRQWMHRLDLKAYQLPGSRL